MNRCFFIILFVLTSLYGCIDCEKSARNQKNYNIEIILTERPYIHGDMKFTGTKLNTEEITTIRIESRWYRNYKDYMEVGDTVIKRKGALILYIHKKDTVMAFKWECEGKIYE